MRNFVREIAPRLIRQYPGKRAEEYARMALDRGLSESNSIDKVFSLSSSLARTVRDGRHFEVVRDKVDGVWCYFPSSDGNNAVSQKDPVFTTQIEEPDSTVVTVPVPPEAIEAADLLVIVGKASSKSDGIAWIVNDWISKNTKFRKELDDAVRQIEKIRGRF